MIRITTAQPISATGTTVEVDGIKIPHLRTVRFEHEAGHAPKVTLELVALDGVMIDGEVYSVMDEIRYMTGCRNCDTVKLTSPQTMIEYLKEFTERHNQQVSSAA